MAKSSLDFIDRRNVKVLTDGRVLTKDDCGRVFVLNSLQGHNITLPSADAAGEGWHAQFVVGRVQTDLTKNFVSSVAATGTETLTLLRRKNDGPAVTSTGVNEVTNALDLGATAGGDGDEEGFTITVGAAAGGSGTQFTFIIQDAALPGTNTAAQFVIRRGQDDTTTGAHLAARVVELLLGTGDSANVERPLVGEGSLTMGIKRGSGTGAGQVVWIPSVHTTDQVRFTFQVPGTAAPAAIALAERVGSDNNARVEAQANVGAMTPATAGVNQTAFVLDTRTVEIHPSGTAVGDVLEVELVAGVWRAHSIQAS